MTTDYTLPPPNSKLSHVEQARLNSYGQQCAEAARAPLIAANAALSEANASLLARIAELERDVKRYRWIRDAGYELIGEDRGNGPEWPPAETVDAFVDAAIDKIVKEGTNSDRRNGDA